jgi:hypothetical protein
LYFSADMHNLSRRHHYIPQCLIRRFAGSDHYLFVYDKQKKALSRKSPKSIFFEMNRNTFDYHGAVVDNVESFYGDFDNSFGKHLNDILNNLTLNAKKQTFLIFMANFLKWRVPASDAEFSYLKKQFSYTDLGLQFQYADDSNELVSPSENSEISHEFKRMLFAFQLIRDQPGLKAIYRDCFMLSVENYPGLIGDCAIVESKESTGEQMNNFLFPLSSKETFIYKKGASKSLNMEPFYICKDIAILASADRYVGCADRQHLELIIKKHQILVDHGKLDALERQLFNMID